MWGYYDGYTAAQIELMACDAPLTVYDHKKNGKDSGKPEFASADADDVIWHSKEWHRKYDNNKDKSVGIDLSGFKIN